MTLGVALRGGGVERGRMSTNTQSSGPSISDLVFVGLNRRVAALHRETGQLIWSWKSPRGHGPVALMLDGDRLIASVHGYTYCIDAANGAQLWHNTLSGFGLGVPCLTSFRSSSMASSMLAQHAANNQASDSAGA